MQINHFYVTWVIGMNGIFYQSAAKKIEMRVDSDDRQR